MNPGYHAVIRDYTSVRPVSPPGVLPVGAVVAVGNFDGVHRGHQAVIARAADIAHAAGLPLGVMTFEPHPRQFFNPSTPPFRLTSSESRIRRLAELGVTFIYELPFDAALAGKTAEEFFDDILRDAFRVKHLVVGYDFVFGKGRTGDVDFLRRRTAEEGIALTVIDAVADDTGEAWSSTRIRAALREGRPAEAAAILGRLWEIEGLVGPGDQRGRQLGFPTANVDMAGYLLPAFGVYAVKAGLVDPATGETGWMDGVANLGRRPTIGDDKVLLEVNLFDFQGDIYGRTLRVAFVDYLRPERKFDGLDALKAQIATDSAKAREVLAGVQPPGVTPAAD